MIYTAHKHKLKEDVAIKVENHLEEAHNIKLIMQVRDRKEVLKDKSRLKDKKETKEIKEEDDCVLNIPIKYL
jgi:hypothetical protein